MRVTFAKRGLDDACYLTMPQPAGAMALVKSHMHLAIETFRELVAVLSRQIPQAEFSLQPSRSQPKAAFILPPIEGRLRDRIAQTECYEVERVPLSLMGEVATVGSDIFPFIEEHEGVVVSHGIGMTYPRSDGFRE